LVQNIVDGNYEPSAPLDAPQVSATASNRQIVLTWTNSEESSNYLDAYRAYDAFTDSDYRFEGYNVFRFDSATDTDGELIAVYDVVNGVRRVIDGPDGEDQITVARGNDSGVRHFHIVDELTNYATYHFGVQAYAFQDGGYPKVKKSPVSRVAVEPTHPSVVASDSALAVWRDTAAPDIVLETSLPDEVRITADVINPFEVTGGVYTLRPDTTSCGPGGLLCRRLQVLRADGDEAAYFDFTGRARVPTTIVFDGLSATAAVDARGGFAAFSVRQNAAGTLDPPETGAFAFSGSGFPHPSMDDRPRPRQQVNGSTWGIHAGGAGFRFGPAEAADTFLGVVTARDSLAAAIGTADYEIRFTSAGGHALRDRDGGDVIAVPFELWNIGSDTPDDSSDDFRMIPTICETACGHAGQAGTFDIAGDHPISSGNNDPFTDWFSWYEPADTSPGEGGYQAYFGGGGSIGREVMRNMVLVNWNGGRPPDPYTAELPETRTVFRIVTIKGLRAGIEYTLDTSAFAPVQRTEVEREYALRDIGIVPNPYRGYSAYQTSIGEGEVRFTNVPAGATVRVFTLNGSLLRTLSQEVDGVLRWDLRNDSGREIVGGMYVVHVDVPEFGSRVLKFGMYRYNTQDE
jgi:hypothetical protein